MVRVRSFLLGTTAAVSLASAASAADQSIKKATPRLAPAVVPAVATWTGCYLGGHGGYGWGRKRVNDPDLFFTPPEVSIDADGFLAGLQTGCDYQFSPNWLLGIEGTLSFANIDGGYDRRPFEPFLIGKAAPNVQFLEPQRGDGVAGNDRRPCWLHASQLDALCGWRNRVGGRQVPG